MKIVKSCIHLGVEMCNNFKQKEHISFIKDKLRKLIYKYAFRNVTDLFDYVKLKIIYEALVESIINYGIVIWGVHVT